MLRGVLLLGPVLFETRVAHSHLPLDPELGQYTRLTAALTTKHLNKHRGGVCVFKNGKSKSHVRCF